MDTSSPPPIITSAAAVPVPDPNVRITEEMYKKNVELAERNKTLMLLRRIDEIILSSMTDTKEIAHAVAKMLVTEAEFHIAAIYTLQEDDTVQKLSLYESMETYALRNDVQKKVYQSETIPLTCENNLIVRCIKNKTIQVTGNLYDLFINEPPSIAEAEVQNIQQSAQVNTTFVYPLVARNEAIGAMAISLRIKQEDLSDHQKDLLSRLYDTIGIAIDNALLYNKVQESNAKLKALDKMKDEFVSLASHELRTPMTAIKSYLWMALNKRGEELSEKERKYLDIAYNSTERLIALVNDMLNVSRIESGRITLDKQPAFLDQIIKDVIAEVMPRAQELGIILSLRTDPSLPQVSVDANKMKEVVMNLVGNSLKFTPKTGQIVVTITNQNGYLQTKIADTGKGIIAEDMPKLFQKFGLIEGSYTQNTVSQGSGLGLYITKSIIEMHGGKIWVTSEGRDKGTQFYFSIPTTARVIANTTPVSSPDTSLPHSPNHQG